MCKNLMWAYKTYSPAEGKYKVRFYRKVDQNEDEYKVKKEIETYVDKETKMFRTPFQLPCGVCIECRLRRAKENANRAMLEKKYHPDAECWMLTLTYDPENLPISNKIDIETGEVVKNEKGTLDPKDIQDFWKRLRRYYEYHGIDLKEHNFKYRDVGEYGDERERPHYHAIVFGLPITDLKASHKSKKGNMNYTSETIQKIWGKGRTAVGTCTWDSCAYVCRYIMKKVYGKGSEEHYKINGIIPEFTHVSKGFSKKYYEDNKESIYETDTIYINTTKGIEKIKPARYYDKMFDIEDHQKMQKIKWKREENAIDKKRLIKTVTNIDLNELKENENELLNLRASALKRKYEKDGAI